MNNKFQQRKLQILNKINYDKSPKGSLDLPIVDLIQYINEYDNMVTTSSCSGRITLFINNNLNKGGKWLYISHDICNFQDIKNNINNYIENNIENNENNILICFRFEPFIMAVECCNMKVANELYRIGRQSGFRESGINAMDKRIIVTIRSSIRLEVPIISGKQMLVDMKYIEYLTKMANEKFKNNMIRIQQFFDLLKHEKQQQQQQIIHKSINDEQIYGLTSARKNVKYFKDILKSRDWLNQDFRITNIDDNKTTTCMILPLKHQALPILQSNIKDLSSQFDDISNDIDWNQVTIIPIHKPIIAKKKKKMIQIHSNNKKTKKVASHTPIGKLKELLIPFLSPSNEYNDIWITLPKKWELLGNEMLLLSSSTFGGINSNIYKKLIKLIGNDKLWEFVAQAFQVKKIGIQREIAPGLKRKSQVDLVLGDNGWVKHRENGVIYVFDVTKSMFSSGNTTERKRMGRIGKPGEIIVDYYAGIGYFTLPYLIHGRASHVYACEWNEPSIEALKRGLKINGIAKNRYTILAGDNRQTNLQNVANRINLGLLPSSEDAWPLAINALISNGGWLHIHGNVKDGTQENWSNIVIEKLTELTKQNIDPLKHKWTFKLHHIERVKSYAPKVSHYVLDIEAKPNDNNNNNEHKIEENIKLLNPNPINILLNPSTEEIDHWFNVIRKPVVLRGLNMGIAPKKWTNEYLSKKTQRKVSVHVCANPELDFLTRNFTFRAIPFSELLQRCTNTKESKDNYFISPNEHYYLREIGKNPRKNVANFAETYPTLAADFQLPPEIPKIVNERLFSSILRVSSTNMRLWTHYDITDNLLCHIRGRKYVVMYPPEDVVNLYVKGSSSPILNIDQVDLNKYPLYAHTKPIACTLEAGDILFIPSLWFHNVTTKECGISINIFWRNLDDSYYQTKDLYGNKDLIDGEAAINEAKKAHEHIMKLPPYYQQFYYLKSLSQFDS